MRHSANALFSAVTDPRPPHPSTVIARAQSVRDGPKQSRGLGSSDPRGQALRGARGTGTGFVRRHLNARTTESCGSLLASGRANFTDGVRRLARHVPAPATHLSARPRSTFGTTAWRPAGRLIAGFSRG